MAVVQSLHKLESEPLQGGRTDLRQRTWFGRCTDRNELRGERGRGREEGRTLTRAGPSPSALPMVSMYFFRSMSRNSNTRYSLESEWTMSSSLREREQGRRGERSARAHHELARVLASSPAAYMAVRRESAD